MLFRRLPAELRGYIDGAQAGRIHGWAWDRSRPRRRLDVEILSAGAPLGLARADGFREDLAASGVGDGRYGFSFELPAQDIPRETIAARVSILVMGAFSAVASAFWSVASPASSLPEQPKARANNAAINKIRTTFLIWYFPLKL